MRVSKLIWEGLYIEEMYTWKVGQKGMGKTDDIKKKPHKNWGTTWLILERLMCHGGLDAGGENANCFEQSY